MESKRAFGEYIREKRKGLGLSQRDLAEKLFISESAVSKWERGVSYPDITLVSPLCEVLGVSEHELITASDDERQRMIEREAGAPSQGARRLARRMEHHLCCRIIRRRLSVAGVGASRRYSLSRGIMRTARFIHARISNRTA